jgi:hypothetical protein
MSCRRIGEVSSRNSFTERKKPMPTDPRKNTQAVGGRTHIARQKSDGSAGRQIFVTDQYGNNIVDVQLSTVRVRTIGPFSWLPRFSANFGSQFPHIVAWSMLAVAIVVLAVAIVPAKNGSIYQTASATTKKAVVTPPPRQQQLAQQAMKQTTLAAAQRSAPSQLPPQQPPPPFGQVPGFDGSTPFVQTKFFVSPPEGETRYVPNELLLQVGADVSRETLGAVAASLGLTILDIQRLGALGTTTIRISTNNLAVAQAIHLLAGQQIIAAATANYVYSLAQDPAARSSEGVKGDAGQYVLGKLRLSGVHRELKGTNISIGVIDSEIDGSHPDLEGVISGRFDATGVEEKPHPHGTGMAGAIASHRKLLGVAPGARLLAIRAFSSKASSAESTTFNILKGLDYAINNGVRIINMSFAGPRDPTLERAFKVAHDKGIVLIAAAGNAGPKSPPLYPAADKSVIGVTATDIDDKLFSGANRGNYIAIAAPGVDILVPAPEGTYQMTTGTSVATAHISGIVALLLERNPKLTPDEIRTILTASANRLGSYDDFGAGLVDPARALKLSEPKTPPPARTLLMRLGLAPAPDPAARNN